MSRAHALALCMGLVAVAPAQAQTSEIDAARAIATPLLADHPLGLWQEAIALWEEGRAEESTFLFYLGQLRWRRYIAARPDLPPDQDAALFGALHSVFGPVVNEWAFGDIDALLVTLRAVAAFDAARDDPMTPRVRFAQVHATEATAFDGFIAYIEAEADDIRATRAANGLPNR